MNRTQPIMLRLALALFIFCVIMLFVVDYLSAEFYIMILSSAINLIFIIYLSIKIRKGPKE